MHIALISRAYMAWHWHVTGFLNMRMERDSRAYVLRGNMIAEDIRSFHEGFDGVPAHTKN